ncbi:hypothetical protein [Lutibacter sp.]
MHSEFQNIIKKWTKNQSIEAKIITLFEKVRDIPYGNIGSRNPLDVYHQNMGTCSGKHALLKALYIELGIHVEDFIIMHSFNKLPIIYPDTIRELLDKTTIIDPHNFIKIRRDNKWISIDATWDTPLKKYGFPVNENWDGKLNMNISVTKEGEIYKTDTPIILKEKLLQNFSKKIQTDRKIFLEEFTKWLHFLRKKGCNLLGKTM